MPTDPLEPVYSGLSKRRSTGVLAPEGDIINALDNLLVEVGWTRTNSYYASGYIDFPLGFFFVSGTTADPKRGVSCSRGATVEINGTRFVPYDANQENFLGGNCIPFIYGLSEGASLANLASAITDNTSYTAGVVSLGGSHLRVTLDAKSPGPTYNNPKTKGDGRFNGGGFANGGGYEWESGGQSVYRVRCFGSPPGFGDKRSVINFRLIVKPDGITSLQAFPDYKIQIPDLASFDMVGNLNGFAVFDPVRDNYPSKVVSFLVAAPFVPANFTAAYAVFAVSGGFRNSTSAWTTAIVCLDGAPSSMSVSESSTGYPRPYMMRSPGTHPFNTLANVPFNCGCHLAMGRHVSDPPKIVGKLHDVICANEYYNPGSFVDVGGDVYYHLSSQDGSSQRTRGSLLWRIDP